jgi:hypothetical protein
VGRLSWGAADVHSRQFGDPSHVFMSGIAPGADRQ